MERYDMLRKPIVVLLILIISCIFLNTAEAASAPPAPSSAAAVGFLSSQIAPTGLIDSYVEDNTDYSYTYDDAMAAMAFISNGDFTSAEKILNAFVAIGPQPEGGFLHRYHANNGTSAGGLLKVGHNTYILQTMNLYYADTDDPKYNELAKKVADYILSQQSSNGGIYGQAGVTWKSTENNLAAYSAVHNLGVLQNISYYTDKAEAIRNFLITKCWNGKRFLCGENDTTVMTDVQALGAMVLGPSYSNGAYWIKGYTFNTQKYATRKTVSGFDQNTDRDTVWTEGTLQESIAYMVAGDINNFAFYKNESEKLFQPSGALWAASNQGTAGYGDIFYRWQAVAPTAWYIYACNQDNVLAVLSK